MIIRTVLNYLCLADLGQEERRGQNEIAEVTLGDIRSVHGL